MARKDTGSTVGSPPLARFCERLKDLQRAAGLTQTSLANAAQLSTSQMSDILNGKIKRLPDWVVVAQVVSACVDHAADKGKILPPDLHDERELRTWRRRYGDLEQDFDAVHRPGPSIRLAAERTAKTVGQSVSMIPSIWKCIMRCCRPARRPRQTAPIPSPRT
jgi:transcriptional regulator with XRE-family HTH domain